MTVTENNVIPGPGEYHKPVILLVEDDILVRFVTADVLRDSGFDVLEAVDAAEALALIGTGHPLDLMITDLRMPGMDGIDLTSRVKSARANLPVMILSSHLEERAHEADTFLAKPYGIDDLVAAVNRLIGAEWRQNLPQTSTS